MTRTTIHPSRRRVFEAGLSIFAGAATTAVTRSAAAAAEAPAAGGTKFVSLLARKDGLTREQFQKAWLVDHVALAYACPGILRYVLTVVDASSTRKDVSGIDLEIDGIAELYFADQPGFELYNASPETRRLRDHGATFIGRQINFITHEKVAIPRGA